MIEVQNLSKSFYSITAVKNLHFSIKANEVTGLLGVNGAGKTTTLRMLTGFYKPTWGSIRIDNIYLSHEHYLEEKVNQAQKRIGYLPESFFVYPNMTIEDFLSYMGKIRKLSKKDFQTNLDYVVTTLNLEKYFYHPVSHLSKGFKQRLGLAGTLIHNPDILILDEPTSGLDPNQIVEIQDLIVSLSTSKTILLSTHILKEAEAMCSRALILHNGELLLDKPLSTIKKAYNSQITYQVTIKFNQQANNKATIKTIFRNAQNIIEENELVSFQLVFNATHQDPFHYAEEVFYLCVKKNLTLVELYHSKDNLENIFKSLTQPKGTATNDTNPLSQRTK